MWLKYTDETGRPPFTADFEDFDAEVEEAVFLGGSGDASITHSDAGAFKASTAESSEGDNGTRGP